MKTKRPARDEGQPLAWLQRGCLSLICAATLLSSGAAPAFSDSFDGECGDEQLGGDQRSSGPLGGRRGGDRRPDIERVLERNAERLGLDAETQDQIQSLAQASRAQNAPLRDELAVLREEMRSMLDQPTPDEAAVMLKADEIGALKTQLRKQQLRSMLEIRALLTPEQRAELVKIHDERRDRRQERRGSWGRRDRRDPDADPEL